MSLSAIAAAVIGFLKILAVTIGPILEGRERARRLAEDDSLKAQKDRIQKAIEDANAAP